MFKNYIIKSKLFSHLNIHKVKKNLMLEVIKSEVKLFFRLKQ
jgi:hypothetical protein